MGIQRPFDSQAGWTRNARSIFKQYVMPAEHGGWFLWIGPFLFGAFAADHLTGDHLVLLLLIVAAFLSRQPLVIFVKALAGRRARAEAGPALKVFAGFAGVIALLLAILLARGHLYLLVLSIPAVPVLVLQLWLVSRRQERQMAIELFGSGVLALAGTAAYWVGAGTSDPTGWLLWGLAWLYNASAVVYVYLRLKQRRWSGVPDWEVRLRAGARTLLYGNFNLGLSLALAVLDLIPPLVPLAFALALAHYAFGVAVPAVRSKPVRIGLEQSVATLAFFLIQALAFRLGS